MRFSAVLCGVVFGTFSSLATAQPNSALKSSIDILSLPPFASPGVLTGQVRGVDPAAHEVACYIQLEGIGWFTKPTFSNPTVPINNDGSFAVDVSTGANDVYASHFYVALVPLGVEPPPADSAHSVPTSDFFMATDSEIRYRRNISFQGHLWGIKESPPNVRVGPGGNYFTSDPTAVFVDSIGHLHLVARKVGAQWHCAEVVLLDEPGYGAYGFSTVSRVDNLPCGMVHGAFTWDAFGGAPSPKGNPNREIDFEDSRFSNCQDSSNAQYVIQPWQWPGNRVRYTIPDQSVNSLLSRVMVWQPDKIEFSTLQGPLRWATSGPFGDVFSWSFEHDPSQNHFVPQPGRSSWRFNLWVHDESALGQIQEVEVVFSDFQVSSFVR